MSFTIPPSSVKTTGTTEQTGFGSLGQDDFLRLLTTQMQKNGADEATDKTDNVKSGQDAS
ncbi:MAG: hypothetical protein B7Z08_02010 [Sphingomonadales bacterium 32-68-7]|nr:MAG: hypothetical protein B7Z08_02010 [Sphingomonadales bacterium 32-68-7]